MQSPKKKNIFEVAVACIELIVESELKWHEIYKRKDTIIKKLHSAFISFKKKAFILKN